MENKFVGHVLAYSSHYPPAVVLYKKVKCLISTQSNPTMKAAVILLLVLACMAGMVLSQDQGEKILNKFPKLDFTVLF